jgi:hypothetical protein
MLRILDVVRQWCVANSDVNVFCVSLHSWTDFSTLSTITKNQSKEDVAETCHGEQETANVERGCVTSAVVRKKRTLMRSQREWHSELCVGGELIDTRTHGCMHLWGDH